MMGLLGVVVGIVACLLLLAALVLRMSNMWRGDVWDEGYDAGHRDARAVQATYPERTTNPYR